MKIWEKTFTIPELNQLFANTASEFLGIRITELGDDYIVATMPLNQRTIQPFGALHGGISGALAETLGSLAGFLAVPEGRAVVGVELNASHLRPAMSQQYDHVIATTTPLRIGNRLQVWQINICDPSGELSCSARLTVSSINIEQPK
ncbi:MAG: hotdog fold thioesterase [Pasteurellaceae bacterium]|nr:hotdog fold thioesterase [Pasteurellaceae bacterium]